MRAATAALALSALLASGACGKAPNSLGGSVSDVYSLDFDTVQVSLVSNYLVVEYLRAASGAKTLKLTLDETGLVVVPGQAIDLTQAVGAGTRGTLQRIVDSTIELPMKTGTLTLDSVPAASKPLVGHLHAMLSDPAGRSIEGDFDVPSVVQK